MRKVVFFDTNILSKQLNLQTGIEELLRYRTLKNEEIELVLPSIVYRELVQHMEEKAQKYNQTTYEINGVNQWLSKEPIRQLDAEYFKMKYAEELKRVFVIFEPEENAYVRVFNRYFARKKPFINKKQEFKDALLWETILSYKSQEPNDNTTYYFITQNSDDFNQNKKDRIEELHQDYLEDFPELILKNNLTNLLLSLGGYKEMEVDYSIELEKKLVSNLEEYLTEHRYEFEGPFEEYIYNFNKTKKQEDSNYILNGINAWPGIKIKTDEVIYKSSLYYHIPLKITAVSNIIEIPKYDMQKEFQQQVEIDCEAVVSDLEQINIVILDRVNVR